MSSLILLIAIAVTADEPADRALVARRLVATGHVILPPDQAPRLHIGADRIELVGSAAQPLALPPDRAARNLTLPHAAAALLTGSSPGETPDHRPVGVRGAGPLADRIAVDLLDAGYALSPAPQFTVCVDGRRVGVARGDTCGARAVVDEPGAWVLARLAELSRPPAPEVDPAPVEPPAPESPARRAPTRRAGWAVAVGTELDTRWAASARIGLVRTRTIRLPVELALGAAVEAGVGVGIGGRWGAIDLTGGVRWTDDFGAYLALPVSLGDRFRVVVAPGWTTDGPRLAIGLRFEHLFFW